MLTKMTKAACTLAAALTLTSTAAQAGWQSIDIDDGSFLPTITYLVPGDDIVFFNQTSSTKVLTGEGGAWTSGDIGPGDRFILRMNDEVPLNFSGESADGEMMEGSFSYEAAPLLD